MGMICALKAGYKSIFLRSLLEIFDSPGGYAEAARQRAVQRPGLKGLDFGGKPHLLDCMLILRKVWENASGMYVTKECIQRCWRKADILPISWNADINNEAGSATVPIRDKKISKEACEDLCSLFKNIRLRAEVEALDTSTEEGSVFRNSFVTEKEMEKEDLELMVNTWVDVEDRKDVIDSIVDEELDSLDKLDKVEEIYLSEDEEVSAVCERPTKRKFSHLDADEALNTLQSYIELNGIDDCYKSLSRLRWEFQKNRHRQPTKSPSIHAFFPLANKKI